MKFLRIATDNELFYFSPERKLWSAVLKRALDDVNHYPPDHRYYRQAIEWLTIPGDEGIMGTLANVISWITTSQDQQDTIIKEIQSLVFSPEKLAEYKEACLRVRCYRFVETKKGPI